ncbi:MAG: glycoside hydrolase family 3 protein [Desulfocapsaceae bacterium]
MDLSTQIGSLLILGFPGPVLEQEMEICQDIVDYNLGGVILFNRCLHTPAQPANIISPTQLEELCTSLQNLADDTLLIGVDQEGGMVRRLRPEAGFADSSSARELGATGDHTALTRKQAETTAAMLADVGINCNFAPVVDLLSNPSNPVIGSIDRSFSEDPKLVARHAAAWIEAHKTKGVLSCLKHFPGHGSSAADSHLGFVDISDTWQPQELEPYRLLLDEEKVDLVMTGHLFNRHLDPTHPATLSSAIIEGLLRIDLGYDGIVVSDDMQMKAITDHYSFEEAVCRSLAAGVDMLVFGNNLDYGRNVCPRAIKAIKNGLDKGVLSEAGLKASLSRVNNLKQRLENDHD